MGLTGTSTGSSIRYLELVRGAWGLVMVTSPRTLLGSALRSSADDRSVVVTRVLGARQLTQAVLSGVAPSPQVLAMGIWVDVAHAATALGLAVVDRRRIRVGLLDATVAAVWAGAGYRDLLRSRAPRSGHDRRRDRLAVRVLQVAPGGRSLLDAADRR